MVETATTKGQNGDITKSITQTCDTISLHLMTHYNCYRYSNVVSKKPTDPVWIFLLKCLAIRLLLLISAKFFAVLNQSPDWLLSPFWLTTVAVLINDCRRFDQNSSPFWPKFSTVLSPFWLMVVAVLTRVVAVMTGTQITDHRHRGRPTYFVLPLKSFKKQWYHSATDSQVLSVICGWPWKKTSLMYFLILLRKCLC